MLSKSTELELSQFFQRKTSKFNLRTVKFITWGRSLTIVLRRLSSPYNLCTGLASKQQKLHIALLERTSRTLCLPNVEWLSQFQQNLVKISKFVVWCWKTSRITSIQTPKLQPQTYKRSATITCRSSFRQAQHNWIQRTWVYPTFRSI